MEKLPNVAILLFCTLLQICSKRFWYFFFLFFTTQLQVTSKFMKPKIQYTTSYLQPKRGGQQQILMQQSRQDPGKGVYTMYISIQCKSIKTQVCCSAYLWQDIRDILSQETLLVPLNLIGPVCDYHFSTIHHHQLIWS